MDRITRRARGVVVEDRAVARVLLDQFARREMVLEIDDHAGRSSAYCGFLVARIAPSAIRGRPGRLYAAPGFRYRSTQATSGPWPISCPMSRSRSPSARL